MLPNSFSSVLHFIAIYWILVDYFDLAGRPSSLFSGFGPNYKLIGLCLIVREAKFQVILSCVDQVMVNLPMLDKMHQNSNFR